MIERLSDKKGVLIGMMIAGLVVLIASGIGIWFLSQQTRSGLQAPTPALPTPPPQYRIDLAPLAG